jgi:hypothetical protein
MIKALIVYALEGYRSIPQLIRELECKPYFSRYVLGFALLGKSLKSLL